MTPAIKLTCPHGHTRLVSPVMAGGRAVCDDCGFVFEIPPLARIDIGEKLQSSAGAGAERLRSQVDALVTYHREKDYAPLDPLERPAPPEPEEKSCPACAEQIKAKALVCRFCGYVMGGRLPRPRAGSSSSGERVRAAPDQRNGLIVLGVVLGLSLVAAIAVGFAVTRDDPRTPTVAPRRHLGTAVLGTHATNALTGERGSPMPDKTLWSRPDRSIVGGRAGYKVQSGQRVSIFDRWGARDDYEMLFVRTENGEEGWIARLQLWEVSLSE